MRIGFDAKRAFHNFRGLGNYSRTVLEGLGKYYPANEYYLYTPPFRSTRSRGWISKNPGLEVKTPSSFWGKLFPGLWRSVYLADILKHDKLDVYHGLSHELPPYVQDLNMKTVVTIHDLLFLRLPQFFSAVDRRVYKEKFTHSCRVADRIIAISEQTKQDLLEYWSIPEEKIKVIYQSCNPIYFKEHTDADQQAIKIKYALPDHFLLYVGAMVASKNVLGLLKAFSKISSEHQLVIVGKGDDVYLTEIVTLIKDLKIVDRVIFLDFVDANDLPIIYKLATCFVYPSFFEGFGLPVIEAIASGTPAVTSRGTSLEEAGGPGALYIDPYKEDDISDGIEKVLNDSVLREKLIKDGKEHADLFKLETTTSNLYSLYQELFA